MSKILSGLSLCLIIVGSSSLTYAMDLLFLPVALVRSCANVSGDVDGSPNKHAFCFIRDYYPEGLFSNFIFAFPLLLLSDEGPAALDAKKLQQQGFTAEEVQAAQEDFYRVGQLSIKRKVKDRQGSLLLIEEVRAELHPVTLEIFGL